MSACAMPVPDPAAAEAVPVAVPLAVPFAWAAAPSKFIRRH